MNSLRKLARLCGQMVRITFTNPRRLSYVFGVALAASKEVADVSVDVLRFPHLTIEDLLPAARSEVRAILGLLPNTAGSISVLEFVGLILLLKKANARSVFEFGTYKGVSITQLALNMPENSRIYTLDLPEDDPRSSMLITDPEDIALAQEKGKGTLVPKDIAPRIQFLRQDSATFDETPFAGQMDLVFVDGAHNTDYVRNDSEKAWRMARSGGIVAWHDCRAADPAVVRYLLECPFRPSRIAGTSLAFAVKP